MNILKHVIHQPFIVATGTAALIHSTWSLGTLFAGEQPSALWALAGWLAPALLIAFALDVGQIVTSAEIRAHGLTRTRGLTFATFALATYYLQWLYIAHHMPELALAAGVRATWAEFATVMRDAAVWVIPALLPLSTLLYTFSGNPVQTVSTVAATQTTEIAIVPVPEVLTVERPLDAAADAPANDSDAPAYTPTTRKSKRRTVSASANGSHG